MLYLSVKFDDIHLDGIQVISENVARQYVPKCCTNVNSFKMVYSRVTFKAKTKVGCS